MSSDENMRDTFAENYQKLGWEPGVGDMEITVGGDRGPWQDDADGDDAPIWMCQTCNLEINRFKSSDGTETFVHSRSWLHHDHDPVPIEVARTTQRAQLCDFCGHERQMYWEFKGENIRNRVGNLSHDYGSVWSACQDCAPLIDAGDPRAVIERTLRVSPTLREARRDLTGPEANAMRDALMGLQGSFMATITSKVYVGPPIVPARLDPRMLPKVREGLKRFWDHPRLYQRIMSKGHAISLPGVHVGHEHRFAVSIPTSTWVNEETFAKHAHHISVGIDVADMYWISEDFTTLATMAGQDLTEMTLTREDLPSSFGLLVYARPIGEIPRPHGIAGIRAISWTLVPDGIWLNVYLQGEDADPEITDVTAMRADWGWLTSPNVGTGIPWGGLGEVDDKFRVAGNFVLTMLATFFLLNQPGVTTTTEAPVDKRLARSYKRANKRLPAVKIVDLRRNNRLRSDTTGDGHRALTVRFPVRGHWRNQAYGPKHGMRRRKYISPFIKGPDDAPLKENIPVVKVLR